MLPEVEFRTTVYVPAGVPGIGFGFELELPPPQLVTPNAHVITASIRSRRHKRLRPASKLKVVNRKIAPAGISHGEPPNPGSMPAPEVVGAVVAIVNVNGAGSAPVTSAAVGLTEHVDLEGRPEHVKLILPVNPFSGVASRP